jgi:hypothetical protein
MFAPRPRPTSVAGALFGLALLFASGGFALWLLVEAVRLNADSPPRRPIPAAVEEFEPPDALGAEVARGPAVAPLPRPVTRDPSSLGTDWRLGDEGD